MMVPIRGVGCVQMALSTRVMIIDRQGSYIRVCREHSEWDILQRKR